MPGLKENKIITPEEELYRQINIKTIEPEKFLGCNFIKWKFNRTTQDLVLTTSLFPNNTAGDWVIGTFDRKERRIDLSRDKLTKIELLAIEAKVSDYLRTN